MASAVLFSLFPLTSRIPSFLFSDWRRTANLNFSTKWSLGIAVEFVLSCHARCVISRLRYNGTLLLNSYLSKIDRIEDPSCSACGYWTQESSHFILHCPATDSAPLDLWRLSVSLRPLVQALESLPASGTPWSSAMSPFLESGREKQ